MQKWIVTRRLSQEFRAEVEVEADNADDAIAQASDEAASDLNWKDYGSCEEYPVARPAGGES